ncbi:hypothetical protein BHE74_00020752 [Ensete ventricosum]|nr:hypothetical protein BHE74_00020752 [Ensete ventricosum]
MSVNSQKKFSIIVMPKIRKQVWINVEKGTKVMYAYADFAGSINQVDGEVDSLEEETNGVAGEHEAAVGVDDGKAIQHPEHALEESRELGDRKGKRNGDYAGERNKLKEMRMPGGFYRKKASSRRPLRRLQDVPPLVIIYALMPLSGRGAESIDEDLHKGLVGMGVPDMTPLMLKSVSRLLFGKC